MGKERQWAHGSWAPVVTSKRVENAPPAMPLADHRQQWASDSTARREGQPRLSALLPTTCTVLAADCAECASYLLCVCWVCRGAALPGGVDARGGRRHRRQHEAVSRGLCLGNARGLVVWMQGECVGGAARPPTSLRYVASWDEAFFALSAAPGRHSAYAGAAAGNS